MSINIQTKEGLKNICGNTGIGSGGSSFQPSTIIDVDVPATWSGTTAPFTQNVAVQGATKTNYISITPRQDITLTQYQELAAAKILGTSQDDGVVTLSAFGEKPAATIPLRFILSDEIVVGGDRSSYSGTVKAGQQIKMTFISDYGSYLGYGALDSNSDAKWVTILSWDNINYLGSPNKYAILDTGMFGGSGGIEDGHTVWTLTANADVHYHIMYGGQMDLVVI